MKLALLMLLGLILGVAAVLILGPREPVDTEIAFDPASLGDDLDAWLAEKEARVPDLRPGVEKRILWAGEAGRQTPLSIVYIHGFSSTSAEISPVPERVAAALGANLFFTRLAGHGRDGAAMAEPAAGDWLEDTAEALAIGRRIGNRLLVIATSTGGTLAAIAATDPAMAEHVAGMVLISPNFGIANPGAVLLSLPYARLWAPLLAGRERSFTPRNAAHAEFWTVRYPLLAAIPVQALVDHLAGLDLSKARMPALFIYSEDDKVVSVAAMRAAADRWGGPVQIELRVMGAGDDPSSHVIAGDILSPGQTDETIEIIAGWASGLPKDE